MSYLPYQLGCVVRTERRLHTRGQIRVAVGDRVEPQTILGVEDLPPEPLIVNLAAALRANPGDVPAALLVKVGERVARGAVLAQLRAEKGTREARAPESGVLASYDEHTGLVTLLRSRGQVELRAQVAGVVREIAPGRSVVIETTGAYVRGAWGVGGDTHGVVRLGSRGPADAPDLEDLDSRFTYSILVLGGRLIPEILLRCEALEVRAVVAAGVSPEVLGQYLGRDDGSLPIPGILRRLERARRRPGSPPVLMLLGGFGADALPEAAWRVLTSCNGREGALHVPVWPAKPRLLVQLPSREVTDPAPPLLAVLEPGALVRVVGGEYAGMVLTVTRFPAHSVRLPSGVFSPAARAITDQGDEVLLPALNLQVLSNSQNYAATVDSPVHPA